MQFTDGLGPESRASLYNDLAAGKRLELDARAGIVLRFGEETGVATPVNRAIYGALKVHDLKARGELVVH